MARIRGKTKDGLELGKIIDIISKIKGINVRTGTKHPYVLEYNSLRPFVISESTSLKRNLVPWMKKATGYECQYILDSFRKGYWLPKS